MAESFIDISTFAMVLDGLATSMGPTVDIYREGVSSYDPSTGEVDKTDTAVGTSVPILQIGGVQLQQGAGRDADKNTAIYVVPATGIAFEPVVNDRVEFPAASVRGVGAYKSMRVLMVDPMVVGGAVLQYTLVVGD